MANRVLLFLVFTIGVATVLPSNSAISQDISESEIFFERDRHGRMLVEGGLQVHYKRGPGYMLIDTGAHYGAVREDLLGSELLEARYGYKIRHISSAGIIRLDLAVGKGLNVLGRKQDDMRLALYPGLASGSSAAWGMIGTDRLYGRIMEIDPEGDIIRMHANNAVFAGPEWAVVDGKRNRYGTILLDGKLDGQPVTVVLATGSSKSWTTLASLKLLFKDRKYKQFDTHNFGGPGLSTHLRNYVSLGLFVPIPTPTTSSHQTQAIGDLDLDGLTLSLINSVQNDVFTGSRDKPFIVLGADVLTRNHVALDHRDHQFWYRPDKEPVRQVSR